MADEKDRFGQKIREKEKGEEDSWFSRREKELLEKLKHKKAGGDAPAKPSDEKD